jgi:hypothetical protein
MEKEKRKNDRMQDTGSLPTLQSVESAAWN